MDGYDGWIDLPIVIFYNPILHTDFCDSWCECCPLGLGLKAVTGPNSAEAMEITE